MSENITGRDSFLVIESLAIAIATFERFPKEERPESNRNDMITLLTAMLGGDKQVASSHIERARDRVRYLDEPEFIDGGNF
ncbi:hypothetical protein [Xanthobacter autotrophicus]|uniref:hypothetical protein n=1 Tax=Xanthobacter autotrophicus TaxID=280 RepID=UPI003727326F